MTIKRITNCEMEHVERKIIREEPLTAFEAKQLWDRLMRRDFTIEMLRFELRCYYFQANNKGITVE